MEYLDRIILDNSVRNYLIVIGTVILILLLKKLLSRPFAILLYHVVFRFWKSIDKKQFIQLILKPLGWFLVIMASIASISSLHFPSAWQFNVFNKSLKSILDHATLCLILLTCTWFLIRLIDFTASTLERKAKLTDDKRDDQIIIFSRDLLKIALTIIGILLTIRFGLGLNISSLLTGLSIIGAALALAAKETIENLIGSFIIFIDKPFHAGDIIRVNNITGTIEHIGMRSTRIRTNDKTLVTIPNKQMVDSVVDNWSRRTERRGEIRLDLSIHASTARLQSLMEKVKLKMSEKKEMIRHSVFFSDLNKSGKTLVIEFFTGPSDMDEFNRLKEELNLAFAGMMEELSIEMTSGTSITVLTDSGTSAERPNTII